MQLPSGNPTLEEGKLCSKTSLIPAFVRFINFTKYKVRIYWLDYEGKKKLYNTIGTGDFLDVNTFVTHLWIFENNDNGDRLMGEWNFVFYPQSWKKENELARKIEPRFQGTEVAIRRIIPITYPLYSLKMRSLQVIRDLSSRIEDIVHLDLPVSLQDELQMLMRKKFCVLNHKPSCNVCSF